MPRLILGLPPDSLRANVRGGQDWHNVLKDKRWYLADCQRRAILQRREWEGVAVAWPTHVRAIVYLGLTEKRKPQHADASDVGFWIKSGLDGLVKLGVFPNDSPKYIRPFTADVARDPTNPRVELVWGEPSTLDELAAALADGGRMIKVRRKAS